MSYSPTLGRWIETDPEAYVDGLNLYQAYRSGPVTLVDPHGTASVDLIFDTGSDNRDKPWVGAPWTIYYGVKGDKDNPGLVRPGPVKVRCSCDDACAIKFEISVKLQIELRNTKDKEVVKNIDGKRVLTDVGRQVYGHEQKHVKDFVNKIRDLVDDIARNTPDGMNAADCKKRAGDAERQLRKAITDFLNARRPGGNGPDLTHGGPGQPVSGVGNDPEGEPGPWVGH